MKPYFVLAGILLAGGVQAEGLYRWVDKTGKVYYGDLPPAEAMQVEKMKFDNPADAVEGEYLSYETRQAQQNFPVTLYAAGNCGEPCQQARDFLNERGIPFVEKRLVTQNDIDNFKKQSGSDVSPTLAIGKTWLRGFQAEQWNDELDMAGYPKTLLYRPLTRPPAKKPETGAPAVEQ
jgi:glutaredoxin